jgi:hypothetical protein
VDVKRLLPLAGLKLLHEPRSALGLLFRKQGSGEVGCCRLKIAVLHVGEHLNEFEQARDANVDPDVDEHAESRVVE